MVNLAKMNNFHYLRFMMFFLLKLTSSVDIPIAEGANQSTKTRISLKIQVKSVESRNLPILYPIENINIFNQKQLSLASKITKNYTKGTKNIQKSTLNQKNQKSQKFVNFLRAPPRTQTEIDQQILNSYELKIRRVPPKIKLLEGDTISIMIFDFVHYPTVRRGFSFNISISATSEVKNYAFYYNFAYAKYSYAIIDSTKMGESNSSVLSFLVTAVFYKGSLSVKRAQKIDFEIFVIDKYQPSKLDFRGLESGFTFLMRSIY